MSDDRLYDMLHEGNRHEITYEDSGIEESNAAAREQAEDNPNAQYFAPGEGAASPEGLQKQRSEEVVGSSDGSDASGSTEGSPDASDGGDQYDSMEYAELQAEAKTRDDVAANGSADDLRARLRDDDNK